MFSSTKGSPPRANIDKVDTIIGKDAVIKGKLVSSGVVRVDGTVEGEIEHNGDLVVGKSGTVAADKIKARHITVAGELRGTVEAEGKLEIVPGGRLYGDIEVAGLIVADGTIFQGTSRMKGASKGGSSSSPVSSETPKDDSGPDKK